MLRYEKRNELSANVHPYPSVSPDTQNNHEGSRILDPDISSGITQPHPVARATPFLPTPLQAKGAGG